MEREVLYLHTKECDEVLSKFRDNKSLDRTYLLAAGRLMSNKAVTESIEKFASDIIDVNDPDERYDFVHTIAKRMKEIKDMFNIVEKPDMEYIENHELNDEQEDYVRKRYEEFRKIISRVPVDILAMTVRDIIQESEKPQVIADMLLAKYTTPTGAVVQLSIWANDQSTPVKSKIFGKKQLSAYVRKLHEYGIAKGKICEIMNMSEQYISLALNEKL